LERREKEVLPRPAESTARSLGQKALLSMMLMKAALAGRLRTAEIGRPGRAHFGWGFSPFLFPRLQRSF
jgi:hypothetical protein